MLYGSNVSDQYHRVGSYVDKILKGTKPKHLPIEQPRKIDFIINRRTARALHLKIPSSVLEGAGTPPPSCTIPPVRSARSLAVKRRGWVTSAVNQRRGWATSSRLLTS